MRLLDPLPGTAFVGATQTAELRTLGVTRRELGGSGLWLPYERGLWAPSWDDPSDPDVRIQRAKELVRDGGALGGWAAARLHGSSWADGRRLDGSLEPLLLCLPRRARCRRTSDVRVFRSDLDDDEVVEIDGVPATSVLRTAADLARLGTTKLGLGRDDVVASLDGLRAATAVDVDAVREWFDRRPRWVGVSPGQTLIALTRDGVRSPQESVLRLLWVFDARLPEPLVNARILTDDGQLLCEADLFDPGVGLAGEYDGGHHASASQRTTDQSRRDEMRRAGVTSLVATNPDLWASRRRTVRRLRVAWEEASARDASGDRWYLAPSA